MRAQKGLVLITAVLIVAIVATLATYLSLGQQMWLRQTENLNNRAQAEALRQAALAWIGILLAREAKENNFDHLGETWAKQLPLIPADNAVLAVSLTDAQGRFNLNNLVRSGQASANDVAAFQRLLADLKLDPLLANALVDWLDTNQDPLSGGGEDVDYLARNPSYRVANQPLASVDELRLIKGFTATIVETLRPHVIALPQENSSVNVNTASKEVLAPLFPAAPGTALATALAERPFEKIDDFWQKLPPTIQRPAVALDVKTQYFLVNMSIRIGRMERRSEALLYRQDNKPTTVVWQRLNPMLPDPKANDKN